MRSTRPGSGAVSDSSNFSESRGGRGLRRKHLLTLFFNTLTSSLQREWHGFGGSAGPTNNVLHIESLDCSIRFFIQVSLIENITETMKNGLRFLHGKSKHSSRRKCKR